MPKCDNHEGAGVGRYPIGKVRSLNAAETPPGQEDCGVKEMNAGWM